MLLLTAPLQHITENSAVEQDPRRVKLWLEKLPIENVQTTVDELISTLKPFNELKINVRTRIKLLEIYHRSFETILYTYDDLHLRTLPLNVEQRRKLSDDIMWVYLELANGYKSIVKAVYEGEEESSSQHSISLSIYRAIELISNALLYAFRDHQTPPPLVYLEIHQLYYLAEQYNIENKDVGKHGNRSSKATIQNLYKQIMLLIAGDAYGFDGSQINELYLLLEKYTMCSQLTSAIQAGQKDSEFYIDFTEDVGPRNGLNINIQLPTQRILDVAPVLEKLISDLRGTKIQDLDSIQAHEQRLLRLFCNNLRQSSIDRTLREPCSETAHVAYGVEATCYYISHREKFLEQEVEEAVNGIEVRDIDMFEAEHELSTWKIANVTPSGRMLVSDQAEGTHYSVGEVVSSVEFLSKTQEHLIVTGFIRWLRYVEDKVQMGIEFLEGIPISVDCSAELPDSDEPINFPALYFPSNKGAKQPASLLFEYSYFSHAKTFVVVVNGQRYRIEPVRINKESPVHIQFSFRIIK